MDHHPIGPVSQWLDAQKYLQLNGVDKMFESLLAALMIERPEDHFQYLDNRLEEIKEKGLDKIDWTTFVYQLHPKRHPLHTALIKDQEAEEQEKGFEPFVDEFEENYEPEVFKLTEPQE